MVSIPVRLFKAARRERIRFHNVYRPAEATREWDAAEEPQPEPLPPARGRVQEMPRRAGAAPPPQPQAGEVARVHNLPAGEFSEEPLEKAEVLKGYEIEKDRYVTFEPREIAALRPKTSTELSILEFARLEEIDPLFCETSYYAAPDGGGQKAYALLHRALVETGYAAIGSFAMHGREHAAVIRPGRRGLVLHTLFYANEVRSEEEYASGPGLVNPKELELAKRFIGVLAAPFEPAKLKDTFEERLRNFIDKRADTAVDAYRRGEPDKVAPSVDILEALRKSLEMARKPPQTEKAGGASNAQPRRKRRRP